MDDNVREMIKEGLNDHQIRMNLKKTRNGNNTDTLKEMLIKEIHLMKRLLE